MVKKSWAKWGEERTREFTNAGQSHPRQMMTAVERDSYHTQQRSIAGGRTLISQTKGGMPKVWGEGGKLSLYLDNGFIDPGEMGAAETVTAEMAEPDATAKTASTDDRYALVQTLQTDVDIEPTEFDSYFRSFTTRKSKTSAVGTSKITHDVLKMKNRAILTCPPAAFTGMARRYVAAIYGRELADAQLNELSVSPSGAFSTLTYDGVTLSPASTGILYSPAHNRYWLLNMTGDVFDYAPMAQTKAGDDLLAALADPSTTEAQKQLLHTYVLSESFVQKNDDGTVAWRSGGIFITHGAPLNFGWRFDAHGNRATMATIEKPNITFNNSYLYSAVLTVAEDEQVPAGDARRFTLSVSVSEEEAHINWTSNKIRIFYPVAMGKYEWLRTGDSTGAADNVPLASFFDDVDALQVCRFKVIPGAIAAGTTVEYSGVWLNGDYNPPPSGGSYYPSGSGSFSIRRKDFVSGDGCNVSLGDFSGTDIKLGLDQTVEYEIYEVERATSGQNLDVTAGTKINAARVDGAPNYGNAATWGFTGQIKKYSIRYGWTASGGHDWDSIKNHMTMLVVPGDCATAWLESMHTATSASSSATYTTPTINTTPNFGSYFWTFGGASGLAENNNTYVANITNNTPGYSTGNVKLYVRNAKGYALVGSIDTAGDPTGPFWTATTTNPSVDFDMLVQDDLNNVYTASNVIGGSDLVSGWPAPTLRSIGWQ